MTHVLVARLDRLGDVLISGPAIRAVAASAERVTVLTSPAGAEAAALLPGVDAVLSWDCPWISAPAPPVDRSDVDGLLDAIAAARIDEALILTSFHQSALPTALLLRMAGVGRIAAVSEDYPGDLLTTRIPEPADGPEPLRMRAIAAAAGYRLPPGDDGRLGVARTARVPARTPQGRFVAVHPGVDAPARGYPVDQWRRVVALLTERGRTVVVTGTTAEAELADAVAVAPAIDLSGTTDVAALAGVLARADVVVAANTGPAHLAAAVGTPVVSLFAPVVPARRWAPYGVPTVVVGDQGAACRDTRARECPVPGHPCLSSVSSSAVCRAVDALAPASEVA
jgi:ADP-heptose:LPS heptosyltransferase